MELKDRLEFFVNYGWKYNPDTGEIISHKGNAIKYQICSIVTKNKRIDVCKSQLAWYITTGQVPADKVYHIDKDVNNNKFNNLTIDMFKVIRKQKIHEHTIVKNIAKEYIPKKHYVLDIELTYEVIISKGKGMMTEKLAKMLIKIVNELSKKFTYYNELDREDCKQHAILQLFTNWQTFNEVKYDKSLPYFTEVAKRGMANCLNQLHGKFYSYQEIPKTISLSNWC